MRGYGVDPHSMPAMKSGFRSVLVLMASQTSLLKLLCHRLDLILSGRLREQPEESRVEWTSEWV